MTGPALDRFVDRYASLRVPLALGVTSIVVGGIVAAVTGPMDLRFGSWMAAFLVLVGGVAQIGMTVGQLWLADEPPDSAMSIGQLATWNGGGAGVIAGTLVQSPALVTVASVVFGASVALFLMGVRGSRQGPRWVGFTYRLVGVIVLLSIPVGITLSWLRS